MNIRTQHWRAWLAGALFAIASLACMAPPPVFAEEQAARPSQPAPIARDEVRRIIAENRRIVSDRGIEELKAIPLGGVAQWISVRGRDRRNPILLVLHGGPGSPTLPVAWTFQSPWEDYFTVVQWDQRGAGRTFAGNDADAQAPGMTIARMTDDAEALVRYLRATYGKQRIFVLGHSWGSVLGVALAQRRPEWLYAYVGVGQIVDFRENERRGYAWTLERARADGNAEAVRELEALAPYPGDDPLTIERIGAQRRWLMHYGGLAWGRRDFQWDADAWKLSPDYTDADWERIDAGGLFSLAHLLAPLSAVDYRATTRFACPVFLFLGRHDYATPSSLAAEWFATLRAPARRLVWFADSAHMPMQEEPGRFLLHLVREVRPLAVRAGDAAPDEMVE
ncbi:MAG TPA: alpha/beta fold hydrolase [Xanthomonadaceae bacterium]|nr:alpha/beta fold hydrolase [Xanthomonadaceae bacterium]